MFLPKVQILLQKFTSYSFGNAVRGKKLTFGCATFWLLLPLLRFHQLQKGLRA